MQNQPSLEPDLILAQLALIFASRDFDASERNRRFLTYVVDETLAGRGDRIKAYSIATSVFGRGPNFDSQLDSIVRIEAGRLRRSLDHYYLTAGMHDGIRIEMPRGAYVPLFTAMGDEPGNAAKVQIAPVRHAAATGPKIFVFDLECEDDDQIAHRFVKAFTRQLIVGLTRFTQIFVYGSQTTSVVGSNSDMIQLRDKLGINYFLSGSATFSKDRLLVDALLLDANAGRYIWAESFDRQCDQADTADVRDQIAGSIVRAIAQPYGVIYSNLAAGLAEGKSAGGTTALDAVMQFQLYNLTYDRSLYLRTRAALEDAIRNDPDYGEGYSCLSRIYIDGVRFGFYHDADCPQPVMISKALDLARRAVSLLPNSSQSFLALGLAYWFRGDHIGGLRALQTGHDLNPYDTETMLELGMRRCFGMDWDRGVPLLEAAYELNPALPDAHRVSLGLWHYAHGRYEETFFEASRINSPGVIYGQFLLAVSAYRLGRNAEAEAAIGAILALDPDYGSHIEADLAIRGVHPDLILRLSSDLRSAGIETFNLPISETEPMISIAAGG